MDPEGDAGWVLIDDGKVSRFGPALALCVQSGVRARLRVLVEESFPGGAGLIARRSSQFATDVEVWRVDGRTLIDVERAPDLADDVRDENGDLAELLSAHGVEPVFEHGVLRGEILGLEVARVIAGRLQVGVGRHDRDARAEMNPGEDLGSALDSAVSAVRKWRRAGVARHPANTLARSRWLRSIVCSRPSLAGAVSLRPVPPPLPWFDLPEAGAAPCVGVGEDGRPIVVVCSVGVDLDVVPTAADCRVLYASPEAPLVVMVPVNDDVAITRGLARMLTAPAEVVTVPRDWDCLAAEP